MSKSKQIMRQGDVLIILVQKLPNKAIKKENVVAYGEVTGHKHQVVGNAQVYKLDTKQFVAVKETSTLIHEEHNTIELFPGIYEIIIQREFDMMEGIRSVLD